MVQGSSAVWFGAAGFEVTGVGAVEGLVASLARRLGVGWPPVWSAVEAVACGRAGGPARVGPAARVGFDETVMSSATRQRRFTAAAIDAAGWVIDVFDGRGAAGLRRWLQQQPRWRAGSIEVVWVDPCEGYPSAVKHGIGAGRLSAGAQIAADPSPHRGPGEPGGGQVPPAHPERDHRPPRPKRRPPLRDPRTPFDRRRAPRRPRPHAPAISPGPKRPPRRGGRLLGRLKRKSGPCSKPQTPNKPNTASTTPSNGAPPPSPAPSRTGSPTPWAAGATRPQPAPAPAPTTGAPRPPTPRPKTPNAPPEASATSTTTGYANSWQPDKNHAKPNPSQKPEPDAPTSSRRAPMGRPQRIVAKLQARHFSCNMVFGPVPLRPAAGGRSLLGRILRGALDRFQ